MLSVVESTELIARIEETTKQAARYIVSTADYTRTDRLWPAHFQLFSTNPLSVAYGACGTALFLNETLGVPESVKRWLLDHEVTVEDYPPGLFMGLAGIAFTLFEIGLHDRAEEVMRLTYRSPLLYREPNMFLGAAGWGLVSLYFYERTGKQLYLDRAVQAGEYLVGDARPDGETVYWRYNSDERVHFGYGYGASGISLFLLYLGLKVGRPAFLECARKGLEFDLSNRRDTPDGVSWVRYQNDFTTYPYMLHGNAGIGAVILRFAHHLGDQRYRALAEEVAESIVLKWSALPSLLEGLSGIGEYMLDLFRFTGDESYRDRALDMAETLLWYKLDTPEGVAFPCRWLSRISNDYATGSAGIGLYLARLVRPGRRLFLDLSDSPR
ncbi:MAG: lanthionine synthetase C family protein, partial [Chloroflexota bacterium]|nr:lanthionine synthetase C family protein [Chloroflexota bacterium]